MPKPKNYPLPWCEELDLPYWRINWVLCLSKDGWRDWQAKLPMVKIIPEIDKLIEKGLIEKDGSISLHDG